MSSPSSRRWLPIVMLLVGACEDSAGVRGQDARVPGAGNGDGASDGAARDAQGELERDATSAPVDATAGGDAAACSNDLREPDDSLSQAERHTPVQGIVPGELTGLVACPGDQDLVWAGAVDAGGTAAAVLTWDAQLGDLQLSLGDADGVPIGQRDVSTARAGRAEERIQEYYETFFYVRVHNPYAVGIPYTLTITAQVFGP